MGKFHILILVLAVSKFALSSSVQESLNGVVTTKPCETGGGDGKDLILNFDACTNNRCDLEQWKDYTLSGSWVFGGENATTGLSFYFSAKIKGNDSTEHFFITNNNWTPEGVTRLVPKQTYSIKEIITVPDLDLKDKNVVVTLKMREWFENRVELCVEADLKINGAAWLLFPAGLLLSLQMLLRLF